MRKRRNEENLPSSSSSSTDSSNTNNNNGYYEVSFTSKHDLSTDLRLGLSISSHELSSSSSRGQYSDWPPIKQLLRSTLAAGKSNNNSNNNNNINSDNNSYYNNNNSRRETLYVKVYMEGIPIGRKLNLLAHHGYHGLITTLSHMFRTTILYPDIAPHGSPLNCHILTYEDKDGDWMMVGDVPWEMFITTVKRLKIVTFERCQ